jgi:hypothetical protein
VSKRGRRGNREDRHATEVRLDAEQSAQRGGNPDRAAAVGTERDRRDAGRDACRGARAGTSRSLGEVPGIARSARQR